MKHCIAENVELWSYSLAENMERHHWAGSEPGSDMVSIEPVTSRPHCMEILYTRWWDRCAVGRESWSREN